MRGRKQIAKGIVPAHLAHELAQVTFVDVSAQNSVPLSELGLQTKKLSADFLA